MHMIRNAAIACAALMSALVLFTAPAAARWAPSGSYESSCRHINYDGDLLTASCRRRDGSWHNTWLDNADDCDANIVNDNGQLECGWRDWRWRDRARRDYDAPGGSYERSCTSIRMDGYTLKATCERRDGSWRWTYLDNAYACDGNIWNNNGSLACSRWRR